MIDDETIRRVEERRRQHRESVKHNNRITVATIAKRCRPSREAAVRIHIDEIMLYTANVNAELEKMRAGMHNALDLPPPTPYATTCAENTFDLLRDLYLLQADLIRLFTSGRLEPDEDDRTLN